MKAKGFTLLELVVTVAIVALLAAIALPSFQTFVEGNRLTTSANLFLTMLNYARSEAIRRGGTVSVCAGNNNTCVCNANLGCNDNWKNGYLIFSDTNSDCTIDAGQDQVLRVGDNITGDNKITGAGCFTFTPMGGITANNNQTVSICNATLTTNNIRNVQLSPTGQARITMATGGCYSGIYLGGVQYPQCLNHPFTSSSVI